MTKIYLFYGEMNILNIFYTCYKYCFLRVLLIRLILVPSVILYIWHCDNKFNKRPSELKLYNLKRTHEIPDLSQGNVVCN